jgi:hypothetical protein
MICTHIVWVIKPCGMKWVGGGGGDEIYIQNLS